MSRTHCRHCHADSPSKPRGLCWSCYYTPGVRDLYPSTSKFARKGVGQKNRTALPPSSTDALPGTKEKLAVLEERARLGCSLFHPDDPIQPPAPASSRVVRVLQAG